jgi:hypothetical protein
MTRRTVFALTAALAWLMPASAAIDAHRLDEYLQAIRVGVSRDRVDLEIDLTPGVTVAAQVFDAIDTDHDGEISAAEGRAYASSVIAALVLDVDNRRERPALSGSRFPTLEQMSDGAGTIRLTATAPSKASMGRHMLRIRNDHRADIGVYLVNALVPADRDVDIVSQTRDAKQRELQLEYRIAPASTTAGAGIIALLALVAWRRHSRLSIRWTSMP